MKNARLRDRVTLQHKGRSMVDFETVEYWTTYADAWAERRDPKADEVTSNLQTRAEMTVTFRIHYRDDVRTTDRLLFRGRTFDIRAVRTPDERERWLLLTAVEHVSNGD